MPKEKPSDTTVTESAKVETKPPVEAAIPKVVVTPPTVTPSATAPSTVLGRHSVYTPPTAGMPINSEGDAFLQAVVDEAKEPCTIVLRSESDWATVARMVAYKEGDYHVRVNEKQEARAVWRRQAG